MDATYYGWHTRGGHVHEPGWYPDPAGAPGRFRWWDGQSWTQEVRDAPGDLDALLNGADAQPPRSSARALGYGTLAIALVVVITGLAAATGASFGRGTPLPLAAQPRGMSDGSGRPVATSPAPAAPAEPASPASATSHPSPSASTRVRASDSSAVPAPGCAGVRPDAATLSDGVVTVQVDGRWTRDGAPDWLTCGQGGRLLAGDGTAQLWVGRAASGGTSPLDATCANMFDQTLSEIGTFRTLSSTTTDVTVAGRPACHLVATTGGGQEPTFQVTLTAVATGGDSMSVIVGLAETDDGEGMRTTEAALRTLAARS